VITLHEPWWVFAWLAICALRCVWQDLQSLWGLLQRWAEKRADRLLKPDPVRMRKFMRHAPSGRVGLCIGSGIGKRWPRLGWLFTEDKIELVMCPACASGVLQPFPVAMMATMAAKMAGHVEVFTAREVVAALPCEIEAFKAAMEKCNPEGTE